MDVNADIELAKNSAQLFSQTLSFTDPTKEDILKNTLIQVRIQLKKTVSYISTRPIGILC